MRPLLACVAIVLSAAKDISPLCLFSPLATHHSPLSSTLPLPLPSRLDTFLPPLLPRSAAPIPRVSSSPTGAPRETARFSSHLSSCLASALHTNNSLAVRPAGGRR